MIYNGGTSDNEFTWQCSRCNRLSFNPWVRKIPWRRKQKPTLVFLPGKVHGQKSSTGYKPWGDKESDTTEHTQAMIYNANVNICIYTCTFLKKSFSEDKCSRLFFSGKNSMNSFNFIWFLQMFFEQLGYAQASSTFRMQQQSTVRLSALVVFTFSWEWNNK